jgi:Zn-dependent peptidase ImmA (M78 family)/transcriptional regulator with XRE-family HTH domain
MIGTSGFHGERLEEAREARGLSVAQLGEMIGVTKQMINLYELVKCTPAPETFEKICSTLRFPKQFFLRHPEPPRTTPIFYRSLKSAIERMRRRAERRYDWFAKLTSLVSKYVALPSVNLPDFSSPADPSKITSETIEDVAVQVRKHWRIGDGVISNIVILLENNGILATKYDFEADELDAFSNWDENSRRPFIVLGADKDCQVRSRFDAAHELAHIILHRNIPIHLLESKTAFDQIEAQAHHFARAFLLPRSTFGQEFISPSIKVFPGLKKDYRVSIGVLIKRAEELNLISTKQAHALWIARTRKGWNRKEPFDDEWEPEQPRFVSRSIELLIDSETLKSDDLSRNMCLHSSDIESITNLPSGSLRIDNIALIDEQAPQLLQFPNRRHKED